MTALKGTVPQCPGRSEKSKSALFGQQQGRVRGDTWIVMCPKFAPQSEGAVCVHPDMQSSPRKEQQMPVSPGNTDALARDR